VHVVEQVDALWGHVHMHTLCTDGHVAPGDRDRARRGDEVAPAVVRRAVGAQLHVAEPEDDRAREEDGRELVLAREHEPPFVAGHPRLQHTGVGVDAQLRLADDDGALLLEVTRVVGLDLPLHAPILDLHAVEVADVLRDLREQLHTELLERARHALQDVPPDLVADTRERNGYHDQQTGA
jgi:hypothetical protein